MTEYIQVEGRSHLVRDKKSNAIININSSEFEKARAARAVRTLKDKELQDLKFEVSEIKDLLRQLLEKSWDVKSIYWKFDHSPNMETGV